MMAGSQKLLNILYCTPCRTEHTQVLKKHENLVKDKTIANFSSLICVSSEQYMARNLFISGSVYDKPPLNYDRWLMGDDDVNITVDRARIMLKHNKPIICLPYLHSDGSGKYNAGFWKKDRAGVIDRFIKPSDYNGLQEVDFAGGGCVMFTREVALAIGFPWFMPFVTEYIEYRHPVSEDHSFFYRAQKAGFKVYCDFDNPVEHKQLKIKEG